MKTIVINKPTTAHLLQTTVLLLLFAHIASPNPLDFDFVQSASIVNIYFEEGFHLQETTGLMISKKHILAPVDKFLSPHIMTAPRIKSSATPTTDGFYCSDQHVKILSRLKFVPVINSEKTAVSLLANTEFSPIVINNMRNVDGSHMVDAQACYKIPNNSNHPTASVIILTLGQKATQLLSEKIRLIGTVKFIDGEPPPSDTRQYLLRDCQYCRNKIIEVNINQMADLMKALREIEKINHNRQQKDQPTSPPKAENPPIAILAIYKGATYLQSFISNWQLVKEYPKLESLPTYHQRHPEMSTLWKVTSPITGTLWHTLKNIDFFGAEHEAPLGSMFSLLLLPLSYVGSLLTYSLITGEFLNERIFCKNYISVVGVFSAALLIKGFNDWWLSDY